MSTYNIVAATSENTVVTAYEPVKQRSDSYQSEAALQLLPQLEVPLERRTDKWKDDGAN